MLPISYPEWPSTSYCNVEEVNPFVLVKGKLVPSYSKANKGFMLACNNGDRFYDILNDAFSDNDKAVKIYTLTWWARNG